MSTEVFGHEIVAMTRAPRRPAKRTDLAFINFHYPAGGPVEAVCGDVRASGRTEWDALRALRRKLKPSP